MLHEFISAKRAELIGRCRDKVAKRFGAARPRGGDLDFGCSMFLQQVADALDQERHAGVKGAEPASAPDLSEIGLCATSHGEKLLRYGYSVDQIVHDYGDVCQAVTDLAFECQLAISAGEFRTLNRCLDDAIAAAVTAAWQVRQQRINQQAADLCERLNLYSEEHTRVVDSIIEYLRKGAGDATSDAESRLVQIKWLEILRSLPERELGQVRMASAMTVGPGVGSRWQWSEAE